MIAELVLPAKIGGLATILRLAIKDGMKPVFRTLGVALLTLGFATEARPQVLTPDLLHELHWRNIGPFRGGRTRAAAGVPDQPHVFYMAQVNGGVWKTDDAGQTWRPVFDAQPTQSVGAIVVAPSNPNIIYVSSGEGLRRPDLSIGDGIYKSTDAGATWTHLGLRDGQQIPVLAVDPHNPDRVFAAVLGHPYGSNPERGIYRSLDGGVTWAKALYLDENTGGADVCLDPANPDVVYASLWESRLGPWDSRNEYIGLHGGLFKSTDGGQSWRKLTRGLPENMVQIHPVVAPSDSRRLYATVRLSTRAGAIYRSEDAGESWTVATADTRPSTGIGGGELPMLKVDPKDPDLVYSPTVVAWRSRDGAKTWSAFKGAPGGDDYQNFWINPRQPEIMLLVSDQGAVVTLNGGRTWSSWYNQPTAQLYHVTADHSFPYRVYSGQQESGSVGIASRGNDGYISFRDWHPVGASEYGYVAPDPLNPNLVYGAGRLEVSRFHWDSGQIEMVSPVPLPAGVLRAVRTQPIMFSPVDPHVLYYAANILFSTTDGGNSWRAISPDLARPQAGIPASLGKLPEKDALAADKERGVIYALAPSPLDQATIWAGTDDGLVWLTTNGGEKWQDVTPPALTPWSKITQIDASRFDRQSTYVSVSRFRVDDLTPYIYRTRDAGKTWQLITAGLPTNAPINTVRADPVRPGLLYAGSENAVWFSLDDGDHWQSLQLNLPHTSMRDLCIHDHDLIVATHGRSFWILDDISPLRQIDANSGPATLTLFQPAPAVRVRDSLNTDTPLPPDEPVGENPPDGAIIDYLLPAPAAGKVTLEILDTHGQLVRRFSAADRTEITPAGLAKLTIPSYWVRVPPILSAAGGLHRWVWDLHYTAPESLRHQYPIAAVRGRTPRQPAGPRALPGQYQVRLTVGDQTRTVPLVVTMDSRVRVGAAELAGNFQIQQQVAAVLDRSTRALHQVRSLLDQVDTLAAAAHGPLADRLGEFKKNLQAQLVVAEGAAASLAGLNRDAGELYSRLDSSDAAPTARQVSDVAVLQQGLREAAEAWAKLLTAEVPALNMQLAAAGRAVLKPERSPDGPDETEEADLD